MLMDGVVDFKIILPGSLSKVAFSSKPETTAMWEDLNVYFRYLLLIFLSLCLDLFSFVLGGSELFPNAE